MAGDAVPTDNVEAQPACSPRPTDDEDRHEDMALANAETGGDEESLSAIGATPRSKKGRAAARRWGLPE